METLQKVRKLQRILELKQKQKQTNNDNNDKPQEDSASSSETQELNVDGKQLKKQQKLEDLENLDGSDSEGDQFGQEQQENDQNKKPGQKPKHRTKIQQAYDKKPYIKGTRRYFKDGEVYYRTATKFFQPQKHYFHKQESSINKTWVYGSGKTTDKLLISAWNINGIRNALHKPTICEYIKNTNADILCMIEVKINEWNYRRRPVKLPGYEGYWNFCKCSAGYSGIAIFSKFQPIAAFEDFQQREFSQQGRVLTLEYQKFYLVAAYIPTAGQNLERLEYKVNQYEKVFYKHCSKLLETKHVIVAGDLNVCHTVLDMHVPKIARKHQGKHPSSTKKQKTNFQKFLNIGFVDTFRRLNPKTKKYSWYNIKRLGREKNLGKRLDYFLANTEFMNAVTRSDVLSDIEGSDHCPIEMNLDLSQLTKQDDQKRLEKTEMRQEYIKSNFMPKVTPQLLPLIEKSAQQQVLEDSDVQSQVKKQQ